jgi:hypothetical protein
MIHDYVIQCTTSPFATLEVSAAKSMVVATGVIGTPSSLSS